MRFTEWFKGLFTEEVVEDTPRSMMNGEFPWRSEPQEVTFLEWTQLPRLMKGFWGWFIESVSSEELPPPTGVPVPPPPIITHDHAEDPVDVEAEQEINYWRAKSIEWRNLARDAESSQQEALCRASRLTGENRSLGARASNAERAEVLVRRELEVFSRGNDSLSREVDSLHRAIDEIERLAHTARQEFIRDHPGCDHGDLLDDIRNIHHNNPRAMTVHPLIGSNILYDYPDRVPDSNPSSAVSRRRLREMTAGCEHDFQQEMQQHPPTSEEDRGRRSMLQPLPQGARPVYPMPSSLFQPEPAFQRVIRETREQQRRLISERPGTLTHGDLVQMVETESSETVRHQALQELVRRGRMSSAEVEELARAHGHINFCCSQQQQQEFATPHPNFTLEGATQEQLLATLRDLEHPTPDLGSNLENVVQELNDAADPDNPPPQGTVPELNDLGPTDGPPWAPGEVGTVGPTIRRSAWDDGQPGTSTSTSEDTDTPGPDGGHPIVDQGPDGPVIRAAAALTPTHTTNRPYRPPTLNGDGTINRPDSTDDLWDVIPGGTTMNPDGTANVRTRPATIQEVGGNIQPIESNDGSNPINIPHIDPEGNCNTCSRRYTCQQTRNPHRATTGPAQGYDGPGMAVQDRSGQGTALEDEYFERHPVESIVAPVAAVTQRTP